MTLKALLFDVDGTLAETERDGHRPAFNKAFADHGLDWHWDESLYGELLAVTGGQERMHRYITDHLEPDQRPADAEDLVPRLHRLKNEYYAQLIADGEIALRPGIRRILDEAREHGLRLAIATTTTRVNVLALLDSLLGPGARDGFELIATADEVPDKKPSPAVYTYCLERMGLAAGECLAIEDSENGVRASLALGIPTLVTVSEYNRDGDFDGALLVVDHLGDPGLPCRILGGQAAGRLGRVDRIGVPELQALFADA